MRCSNTRLTLINHWKYCIDWTLHQYESLWLFWWLTNTWLNVKMMNLTVWDKFMHVANFYIYIYIYIQSSYEYLIHYQSKDFLFYWMVIAPAPSPPFHLPCWTILFIVKAHEPIVGTQMDVHFHRGCHFDHMARPWGGFPKKRRL